MVETCCCSCGEFVEAIGKKGKRNEKRKGKVAVPSATYTLLTVVKDIISGRR